MRQSVSIPDGILLLSNTDFECPKCGQIHNESDWYPKLQKSTESWTTKRCKNKACNEQLGITMDIMGDVVCWKHSEEEKLIEDEIEWYF